MLDKLLNYIFCCCVLFVSAITGRESSLLHNGTGSAELHGDRGGPAIFRSSARSSSHIGNSTQTVAVQRVAAVVYEKNMHQRNNHAE